MSSPEESLFVLELELSLLLSRLPWRRFLRLFFLLRRSWLSSLLSSLELLLQSVLLSLLLWLRFPDFLRLSAFRFFFLRPFWSRPPSSVLRGDRINKFTCGNKCGLSYIICILIPANGQAIKHKPGRNY
jgi:hypothetical protein